MRAGDAAAVIGKSVQIRGEVRGSEDLLIEGLVEGTLALSDSRLTIGTNARVQANVSARDVIVQGTLQGNIEATGRVDLRAGSSTTGDIRAGRLSIEESAIFSGKVELNAQGSERPVPGAPGQAAAGRQTPALSASR